MCEDAPCQAPNARSSLCHRQHRLVAQPQVLIGDSGAPGARRAGEAGASLLLEGGAAGAWFPETLDKGLLDMLFLTC